MSTTSKANRTDPDIAFEGRAAARKSAIDAATASSTKAASTSFTAEEIAAAKALLARTN